MFKKYWYQNKLEILPKPKMKESRKGIFSFH
jgi:hypothetical protein